MSFTTTQFIAMQLRLDAGRKKKLDAPADAVEREADLHEQINDYFRSKGWSVVRSRMDMRTTTAKGVADFIIFADYGRTICVECKTRLGKLSIDQLGFKMHLEKLGHVVHVVRGFSEFLAAVNDNPQTTNP